MVRGWVPLNESPSEKEGKWVNDMKAGGLGDPQ